LVIPDDNPTEIGRSGSGQVEFHFCARCRDLAYAVYSDAESKSAVAVARLALFDAIAGKAAPVKVTDFPNEDVATARRRRLAAWTPVTHER
jgi:hypothetical protein